MKALLVKGFLVFALPLFVFAQKDLSKLPTRKSNSFELRIDKAMTDDQLKQDEIDAKKYDFEVSFSGVKRNDKKEITAIKIAYKDQDGNSGTYNVADETPIKNIIIVKKYDAKGKGFININGGNSTGFNDSFVWNGAKMFDDDAMFNNFNNDVFKNLMDSNKMFMQGEFNGSDFGDLEKLKGDFLNDSLPNKRFSKSFIFKDGKMLNENPDMKLEEEKVDEDGTVTKKYSDGNGNTMIFSEKNFSSQGSVDDLEQLKKDSKIKIEKHFKSADASKEELERLKAEIQQTKSDLEKLKSDLQKDKPKTKR